MQQNIQKFTLQTILRKPIILPREFNLLPIFFLSSHPHLRFVPQVLSLLTVQLWPALIEDIKIGTYELPCSLSISITIATVIPSWGTMRQLWVHYFAQYGYHRFFSFLDQTTHKLCPCGHNGDEQTRIDVSAQMSYLMSAFKATKLDRITH